MPDIGLPSAPLGQAFREAADSEAARGVLGQYLVERNEIWAAKIVKVWPRPDGVFVLLYEITDDKGTAWVAAFLFPPQRGPSLRTPRVRATHIPEWNAYVQVFPNDYRMPLLRIAAAAFRARDIIASALDSAASRWRGFCLRSVKPWSYWPSRKCLLKYKGNFGDNSRAKFYIKLFFDDTAERLLDLHKALRAGGLDGRNGLQVSAPIGHCKDLKAALFAPARGSTLLELMNSPLAGAAAVEAGRLLGKFHGTSIHHRLPVHGPAEEMGILQGWVQAVESVGVQDMSGGRSLLRRLEDSPAAAGLPFIFGHGDFYDKQLLFNEDIMTVLDLDMACRSHAERDVGNFLAHLELRGLENSGRADQYISMARPFAEAYERCMGRLSEPALHWYCASTFLRLACRAATQPAETGYFASLIALAEREIKLI